jgi:hypothetical protein
MSDRPMTPERPSRPFTLLPDALERIVRALRARLAPNVVLLVDEIPPLIVVAREADLIPLVMRLVIDVARSLAMREGTLQTIDLEARIVDAEAVISIHFGSPVPIAYVEPHGPSGVDTLARNAAARIEVVSDGATTRFDVRLLLASSLE